MTRFFSKRARRFARRDDGSATVEFSILFVPMITFLLSAVEVGFVHIQHSMLEQALDQTVRDIRIKNPALLDANDEFDYGKTKQAVCDRAGFIDDCGLVKLQLMERDPRAWADIPADADCVDNVADPDPPVQFEAKTEPNDLMFIRACALFKPVFPTIGLGSNIVDLGTGHYALVAAAAFAQEPE